MIIKIF